MPVKQEQLRPSGSENTQTCSQNPTSVETTQAPTATLAPYQQIRFGDKPFGRQICLAAVGSEALLPLLQLWSQLRQNYPKLVLQLLLFAADKDSRAESLKVLQSKLPLWQTTEATAFAEHQTSAVMALLAELQAGKPLAIPGCQRFVLDGGRLTLDLYLEFDATLLKELPGVNHNGWIDNWLWLAESLPSQAAVWQMARLAKDYASLLCLPSKRSALASIMVNSGLNIVDFNGPAALLLTQQTELEPIAKAERLALRRQSNARLAPWPLYREPMLADDESIAIIGAGVAGSQLALSLAERQQASQVFCSEDNAGESASGNRQGALYPLLTPETSELNTLFQQGFLFSRRRITALTAAGFDIAHDFCGVLHTGYDERSRARLDKIAEGQNWHPDILRRVDSFEATELAGLDIEEDGLFYPLGGWVCPRALCRAAIQYAVDSSYCDFQPRTHIKAISREDHLWWLSAADGRRFGPFKKLVLASGASLTALPQTSALPASPFRGQVSEVATQGGLGALKAVLCAKGYLTPAWEGIHCLGASYIKDPEQLAYSDAEQRENLQKIAMSYPDADWHRGLVMGQDARVGVRMVTRDHFPMLGQAPDVGALMQAYQQHQHTPESARYWQQTLAPVHPGLYILGGLGSRGLSTGPLAAEILASELCHQPLPVGSTLLQRLNPNRMWMRKLIKGKAL
ncbi:hypothetical protein AYI96_00755 [Shewanella sp. MSW]|nr:hypothetical protein AYI96_00755 [Shewanella sp. MSW]